MGRIEIVKLIRSSRVYKFNSPAPDEFIYRATKPHYILHGDDGKFWVTTAYVAGVLESAGYEIVG